MDAGTDHYDNIPKLLRDLPNWIIYKDRKSKIPLNPRNFKPASTIDPAHRGEFKAALSALKRYAPNGNKSGAGLGFVFSSENSLVGIDLDDAVDLDGIKPWAKRILKLCRSYTEYSPSGKGFHIICQGKKPGEACKKTIKNKAGEVIGKIEMYEHSRYFTMTGNPYFDGPGEVLECQVGIERLYKALEAPTKKTPEVKTSEALGTDRSQQSDGNKTSNSAESQSISTADIISIIKDSNQAEKFQKLMSGSLEAVLADYGGDHSAAVYALSSIVAFYTDDFRVMDGLFRQSSLYSKHWAPNSDATGAKAHGKWERLGNDGFRRKRTALEKAGDVYGANSEGGSSKSSNARSEFSAVGEVTRGAGADKNSSDGGKSKKRKSITGEKERKLHIQLLSSLFSECRRDIFSRVLYGKSRRTGEFEPVFTRTNLGWLKALCQEKGDPYKSTRVENYLRRYEGESIPKLLVDLPKWDGEDRISYMCSLLSFAEETMTTEIFTDLFKDWCARLWQRVTTDEMIDNRCIILTGKQGIGKDVWVWSMFKFLQVYLSDLTIDRNTREADIAVTISQSICCFISEFDKTEVLSTGQLKDILTKPYFTLVKKYEADPCRLKNRCSFIAAANPQNVLRDVTGNRRFMVIHLKGDPGEAIKWEYPMQDMGYSAQILAQCADLATNGYHSSPESENVLKELTAMYTPDDPAEELIEDFEDWVRDKIDREPFGSKFFRVPDIESLLVTLGKTYGMGIRKVLSALKQGKCQRRTTRARFYSTREICADNSLQPGEAHENVADDDDPFDA